MAAIFCAAGPWICDVKFDDIPEYPAYVSLTPVPDFQSMPEHPGYAVFDLSNPQLGQLWPGLSSNPDPTDPPDKEIAGHAIDVLLRNARFLLDVIANMPCHLVDPGVPAMILKTPDDQKPEEPKSWQPDQINESLLKGRICDW